MAEYIDYKRCSNCDYSCNWEEYKIYGFSVQCTRYPKWVSINEPYFHGCGEWKMRSEKEEGGDNEQT